jgi:hypothetical protein
MRVLLLPGLPDKGDASDWIAAGGTAEQFWALVEAAPEWIAPPADAASPDDADASKKKAEADAETQRIIDELAAAQSDRLRATPQTGRKRAGHPLQRPR